MTAKEDGDFLDSLRMATMALDAANMKADDADRARLEPHRKAIQTLYLEVVERRYARKVADGQGHNLDRPVSPDATDDEPTRHEREAAAHPDRR